MQRSSMIAVLFSNITGKILISDSQNEGYRPFFCPLLKIEEKDDTEKDFFTRWKFPSPSCGTLLDLNLYPCCTIWLSGVVPWGLPKDKSFILHLFFCCMELKETPKQPEYYVIHPFLVEVWNFNVLYFLLDTKVMWNWISSNSKRSCMKYNSPTRSSYLMDCVYNFRIKPFCGWHWLLYTSLRKS